jgi:hypothetical protein
MSYGDATQSHVCQNRAMPNDIEVLTTLANSADLRTAYYAAYGTDAQWAAARQDYVAYRDALRVALEAAGVVPTEDEITASIVFRQQAWHLS